MKLRQIFTVVFVKNGNEILLGLKKRGFGVGKWNGFGGKVEESESVFDAAVRETKEECNLKVEHLNHIGIVIYEEKQYSKVDVMHVFTTNKYSNIVQESEEMMPAWYNVNCMPYSEMWPDSRKWYPSMLKENYFCTHVIYDKHGAYQDSKLQEFESIENVFKCVDARLIDIDKIQTR